MSSLITLALYFTNFAKFAGIDVAKLFDTFVGFRYINDDVIVDAAVNIPAAEYIKRAPVEVKQTFDCLEFGCNLFLDVSRQIDFIEIDLNNLLFVFYNNRFV